MISKSIFYSGLLFLFGMWWLGAMDTAMSTQQRNTLKIKLQEAKTSQEVEELIREQLEDLSMFSFKVTDSDFQKLAQNEVTTPYIDFTIEQQWQENPLYHYAMAVRRITRAVFFEMMIPYMYNHADLETELPKFEKFRWAEWHHEDREHRIVNIVDVLRTTLSEKNSMNKKRYATLESVVRTYLPEEMRPRTRSLDSLYAKYIIGGVVLLVVSIGGAWYCGAGRCKEEPQEDDQGESSNDNAKYETR